MIYNFRFTIYDLCPDSYREVIYYFTLRKLLPLPFQRIDQISISNREDLEKLRDDIELKMLSCFLIATP